MSKNYYTGSKKNFFLGVINRNVIYVTRIKTSKPLVQFLQTNTNKVINHIKQNYTPVKLVTESKYVFLDIIHLLNYFKQKQDVVVNGLIYSELYYMLVDLKLDLFLIMKIMSGMNFIMRKKKDGFMLTLAKKLMILLWFMNKGGKEI